MKYFFAFITVIQCCLNFDAIAQNLTRAQVYSMQAGDVFVFSIDYDSRNRVDVDTILTRKDINADSVVFTIKTTHFVFEPQLNNWIRTFEYFNKSFGQLSQPFFEKFTQCDTVIKLGDSTFTYGEFILKDSFFSDTCGNIINDRFERSWAALSGSSESHSIAYAGVGAWVNWEEYDTNLNTFKKLLLYMNKNGITCGNSKIIKTINNDIGLTSVYHQVKIYPNPSTSLVNIEWEEEGNYSIINSIGVVVLSGNLIENKIDISPLQAGIYHLIVNSGSKTLYQKIVKE